MVDKTLKNASGFRVSTSVISDIFNVSTRRVRQLVEEGVIDRASNGTFELVPTVKKYILNLKLKDDSRAEGKTIEQQLEIEKIRNERAKADMAEMKLARMQGTMHDAIDVERVMTDMLSAMRAKLLGMPSKIAPVIVSQDEITIIQEIIRKNIYEALQELSEYDPEMFYSEDYIDQGDGDET